MVMERLLPEKLVDLWRGLTYNAIKYRSVRGGFAFNSIKTMGSGEMTTSSTNTELNLRMIQYAIHCVGLTDYDFFVEGDDMILAYNIPEHFKPREVREQIQSVYDKLGFVTKVEHEGTMAGAQFVKINF